MRHVSNVPRLTNVPAVEFAHHSTLARGEESRIRWHKVKLTPLAVQLHEADVVQRQARAKLLHAEAPHRVVALVELTP